MTRRHMSRKEILAVAELLRLHATVVDGAVHFSSGYDDAKIAALVAPDLNAKHVANLRIELMGHTSTHSDRVESTDLKKISARMAAISDRQIETRAEIRALRNEVQAALTQIRRQEAELATLYERFGEKRPPSQAQLALATAT